MTKKTSKKLNIGCGSDIKEDHINIDFMKLEGVDVVHDLNKFPWPFKSNTFESIFASHVLEQVDDLVKVAKEMHKISKKGAKVSIRVPPFSCGVSYRDPTHKRFFSYFTFDYFSDNNSYYSRKDKGLFIIRKRKLNFTRMAFKPLNYLFNPLININPAIYERFFCWMLPCSECIFELEVQK